MEVLPAFTKHPGLAHSSAPRQIPAKEEHGAEREARDSSPVTRKLFENGRVTL